MTNPGVLMDSSSGCNGVLSFKFPLQLLWSIFCSGLVVLLWCRLCLQSGFIAMLDELGPVYSVC